MRVFVVTALLAALVVAGPVSAQPALDETVLLYRNKTLQGRWSIAGNAQEGLDRALKSCNQPGVTADGKFGPLTRAGMRRLAGCSGYAGHGIEQGGANDGRITVALWKALRPNDPLPSLRERIFTLWVTHEATDYDRVEFNFRADGSPQKNDPASYLTWGPYGATAGHGGEVQAILSDSAVATAVNECFTTEADTIRRLAQSRGSAARDLVHAAFIAPSRRAAWKAGFVCLGMRAATRAAYDAYAFDGGNWFRPAMRQLYTLIPNAATRATAVDFAFFGDLAMHVAIKTDRVSKARDAITQHEQQLGRVLEPFERRRVIGETLVPFLAKQHEDRRGRNVVYYVDGLGEANLSQQERTSWRQRTGLKASDFGLGDSILMPPP